MGDVEDAAAVLREAKKRVELSAHLARREQRLQDELDEARDELAALTEAVGSEGEDVRRLQNRGLSALIAGLTGGRQERLDRERVELAQAQLRWQTQAHHVATLERDRAAVEAERFALEGAAEDEARCRHRLLQQGADEPALADVLDAVLAVARHRELVRELTEARRAGRQALRRLAITQQRLDRAAAWSAGDVLGGGSLISAVKLNHMEQAHEGLLASREAFVVYRRELADVEGLEASTLELSPSFGLLDLWFEGLVGLVVDLRADERIRKARGMVTELRAAVADQTEELDRHRATARAELSQREGEERDLLDRASGS